MTVRPLAAQLFIVISVAVLAAEKPPSQEAFKDKELEGTWKAISAEEDGQRLPESSIADVDVTFEGDLVTNGGSAIIAAGITTFPDGKPKPFQRVTKPSPRSFVADATKNPKELDVEMGWSGRQVFTPGGVQRVGHPIFFKSIFTIKGDELMVCWGRDERPKSFKTKAGDGFTLVTYKRVRPEEKKEDKRHAAEESDASAGSGKVVAPKAVPQFEVVASLILPDNDRFPGNHAFRSAAIGPPWVYVLDREGSLYVFRIPEGAQPLKREATTVVKDVGDGNDLKVIDQTLLCTRNGSLEAYSLKTPENPKHLGRFGPVDKKAYHSQTLVHDGKRAFLVGRDAILAYDLSAPAQPKNLSILRTGRYGWTGCVSGQYLYVAEINVERGGREGIAVYDVADPRNVKEVGFTPTREGPYHLFSLPGNRLLASQDAESRFQISFGNTVHGTSAFFSLARPTQPALLKEFASSGGRTAAFLSIENQHFLVCDGGVFAIGDKDLKECFSFYSDGSTLDGLPYHGSSSGPYTSLAMDGRAIVVRRVLRGPDGRRLGMGPELDPLQGTWKAVSGQERGKPLSESELAEHDMGSPITFDGYHLRISYSIAYTSENPKLSKKPKWHTFDMSEWPLAIKVNTTKTPKELTIYGDAEDKSSVLAKCIYTFENDRLRICWGSEKERPKEFKTTEKDGFVLVVYQRAESTSKQESRATTPGH